MRSMILRARTPSSFWNAPLLEREVDGDDIDSTFVLFDLYFADLWKLAPVD